MFQYNRRLDGPWEMSALKKTSQTPDSTIVVPPAHEFRWRCKQSV